MINVPNANLATCNYVNKCYPLVCGRGIIHIFLLFLINIGSQLTHRGILSCHKNCFICLQLNYLYQYNRRVCLIYHFFFLFFFFFCGNSNRSFQARRWCFLTKLTIFSNLNLSANQLYGYKRRSLSRNMSHACMCEDFSGKATKYNPLQINY